ncbi:hypothetical protein ABG768_000083, partial [Culter alburnus]
STTTTSNFCEPINVEKKAEPPPSANDKMGGSDQCQANRESIQRKTRHQSHKTCKTIRRTERNTHSIIVLIV